MTEVDLDQLDEVVSQVSPLQSYSYFFLLSSLYPFEGSHCVQQLDLRFESCTSQLEICLLSSICLFSHSFLYISMDSQVLIETLGYNSVLCI